MADGAVRHHAAGPPIFRERSRSASALAELLLPLDRLLASGGDPRLNVDPASGINQYGC